VPIRQLSVYRDYYTCGVGPGTLWLETKHGTEVMMFFSSRMLVMVAATALTHGAFAATLFSDGFESGNLSTTQNQVRWIDSQDVTVSTDVSSTGKYALKFNFVGGALGTDAWAEQRISLPRKSDYWFKYRLYIPSNYVHRVDDYSNNKFLAVYQAPYLKDNPGFQVNFSLQANGSGGSDLEVHHYNGGIEGPVRTVAADFIKDSDKGKWMDLVAEVKVPTSATSKDGVMRLWKNNQLVTSITDLPSWGGANGNYIDQAYFLGWSNSGFAQTTSLYIDDVVIADTSLNGTQPKPPTNAAAQ
jgi:hypothetical protein